MAAVQVDAYYPEKVSDEGTAHILSSERSVARDANIARPADLLNQRADLHPAHQPLLQTLWQNI